MKHFVFAAPEWSIPGDYRYRWIGVFVLALSVVVGVLTIILIAALLSLLMSVARANPLPWKVLDVICWDDPNAGTQCAFGESRRSFPTRDTCIEANGGQIEREVTRDHGKITALCLNWRGEN